MLPWEKRPFEIANLLNPAFCSVLMYSTVNDFEKECKRGMPFVLTLLILPLVLHRPTRETLPQTARTQFQQWVKEQSEEFSLLFAVRTRQLLPYSKEAITFGMQRHILEVDDSENVVCGKNTMNITRVTELSTAILIENSRLIGRWFAKAEHEAIIFKTLGIRP